MSELFGNALSPMHWAVLAVILLALEVMTPGIFFLWLGVAAGLVAGLTLIVSGLSWQTQVLIFAPLCLVCVFVGRQIMRRLKPNSERGSLNRRGEQYVGRVFTVETAISNGVGALKVGDSIWRAEGPDMPVGAKAKVIGIDGASLKVEPSDDALAPPTGDADRLG
jgi:membrane protein implicated in regulation of membrane protease activity